MGTLTEDNGTTIELGKKLCRGSWNARPWGPLDPAMVEGLDSGTDLYFNKSKQDRLLCNTDRFSADIPRPLVRPLGQPNTARTVPPRVTDDYALHWWCKL